MTKKNQKCISVKTLSKFPEIDAVESSRTASYKPSLKPFASMFHVVLYCKISFSRKDDFDKFISRRDLSFDSAWKAGRINNGKTPQFQVTFLRFVNPSRCKTKSGPRKRYFLEMPKMFNYFSTLLQCWIIRDAINERDVEFPGHFREMQKGTTLYIQNNI